MSKIALITGITGFAGSHLADYILKSHNCELFGIKRWRSRTENIEHLGKKVTIYECNIRDATSTRGLIEKIKPDRIFHLAAQSFVPTSWTAPEETLYTNIIGELNIFRNNLHCIINITYGIGLSIIKESVRAPQYHPHY